MNKNSIWNRFDRKVILYFTGSKDTRTPSMEKELKRVGLDGADRQWQFPTPIDKVLLRSVSHVPCLENKGYFNSAMGHYRAIATAYHLGCESVLIMEDDIRFLKDLKHLKGIVDSMPDDYDVALLDSFFRGWEKNNVNVDVMGAWRDGRKVNDNWSRFDALYSLGCYALSRKGMKRMMFAFEAVETDRSIGKLRIADHYLDRRILGSDMNMYFARKNAAIQSSMSDSNSPSDDIRNKYIAMGLDLSEYAEA